MNKSPVPVLSFVIPCLNEAKALSGVIEDCCVGGRAVGLPFEVVIADNGSTDGSQEIAAALGARIVSVSQRGYGAALIAGIEAATGIYVLMGDADGTYDFRHAPRFLHLLQGGADLVMGNRFKGEIEPGAMPPLHRWLGNPILSGLGRLFFGIAVTDFHCGLRGFRRDAVLGLCLVCPGMEFASEMVIKASLRELRIEEVATSLRCDHPDRSPHLRTWRDGWRHLKFMLSFSPKYSFLPLAVALLLSSLISFASYYLALDPFSGANTLIFSSFAFLAGLGLLSDYLTTRVLFADAYGRPIGLGAWLNRWLVQPSHGVDRLYQLAAIGSVGGLILGLVVFTRGLEGIAFRRDSNLLMYGAALLVSLGLYAYLTAAKISTIRSLSSGLAKKLR